MSVLGTFDISEAGIISPFEWRGYYEGMSYGCGPAGYDIRIEFDSDGSKESLIIPTGGFTLASSIEYFTMPSDILGVVHDKSSWARKGIFVQNTVAEPGWSGYLTLEISNNSGNYVILKRGMPIAQVVFHRVTNGTTYEGKYQNQKRGPVGAIERYE